MRWRVVLCGCNETLPWDAARVQHELALDDPPDLYQRLPRDEVRRFVNRLGAGGFDRVLVACCAPETHVREVAGAAGLHPEDVVVLDPKERCFRVHPEHGAANVNAVRLMRAAMAAGRSPSSLTGRPPGLAVTAGPSVVVATDSPAGLALARRLGEVARPVVVLDERSAAFDGECIHPLPWKVSWGAVARVEGSLGRFRVTIERAQPIDLDRCVLCQRCVPVCHTAAISQALRLRVDLCDRCGDCLRACEHVGAIRIPRAERETITADQVVVITEDAGRPAPPLRTGHHVLRSPGPGEIDALAWKVLGLIGEFRKPRYVTYDAGTCAGGAAGRQACGRCITACPYAAIARSPGDRLRIVVDQAACEGCGACVATCPTSSLRFTDPSSHAIARRLDALLRPVEGESEPLVAAFHCPERGAGALAEAGRLSRAYPASVLPVPMACLRHVSEATMLDAFRLGASGVALLGCEACPHGERELLLEKLETTRTILEAFELGGDRVRLVTGEGPEAIDTLGRSASSLAPSPVRWAREGAGPIDERDRIAAAIWSLIAATGRESGRTRMPAAAPFAFPDVQVRGCTLCRTCVNVCPTRAFRYDGGSRGRAGTTSTRAARSSTGPICRSPKVAPASGRCGGRRRPTAERCSPAKPRRPPGGRPAATRCRRIMPSI